MPRKSNGPVSKTTTASKAPVKRSTPTKQKFIGPKFKYEVKLYTGHGTESLYFNEESQLERFKINVTKRNLETAPLKVTDATETLFIIRGFLFAKVITDKS